MRGKNTNQLVVFRYITIIVSFLFFVGMAIVDGPVWCVDSQSYVSMEFYREPVYPLFLAMLRNLCARAGLVGQMYGYDSYLFAAVILQSLLWGYVTVKLGFFVQRRFGVIAGALAVFFQIAVSAINRFVANRRSMYSEAIMTEALAMPLFVLANIFLWELFEQFKALTLIKLFLVTVLIASIRKQMLIVLLIWMASAVLFYLVFPRERSVRKLVICMLLGLTAYITIGQTDKVYNFYERGVYTSRIRDCQGTLDTLIYTETDESISLFDSYQDSEEFPHLEEAYANIFRQCSDDGYVIEASPNFESREKMNLSNADWLEVAEHFASVYDHIGYDVILPCCQEYVKEYFPDLDSVSAQIKENEVEKQILKVLLKDAVKKAFSEDGRARRFVFGANVLKAFVISVANTSSKVLVEASALIYVIYLIILMLALFKRKKPVFKMGVIVLTGVVINCLVTGAVIFPQPRYMCYSMGLFYLAASCGILYESKFDF